MQKSRLISAIACGLLITIDVVAGGRLADAETPATSVTAFSSQDGASTAAASASGNWQITWTDKKGDAKQGTLYIQQNDTTLSGKFQGQRYSASISGTLQGSQVSLTLNAHGHKFSFTGTLDGDKMSGATEQGKPWSATRQ